VTAAAVAIRLFYAASSSAALPASSIVFRCECLPFASSFARCVARFTALISVTRNPPSSSSRIHRQCTQQAVVKRLSTAPDGYPVSAVPFAPNQCRLSRQKSSTSRGNPTLTPASARASMMMYKNAGPIPTVRHRSICFSSTTTVLPTV